MIGPLQLAQVTTHMGQNYLCLCCCDDEESVDENLGGSSFQEPRRERFITAQAKAMALAAKNRAKVETELLKPSPGAIHHKTDNVASIGEPVLKTEKSSLIVPRSDNWGVYYITDRDRFCDEWEEEALLLTMMIEDDDEPRTDYRIRSIEIERTK